MKILLPLMSTIFLTACVSTNVQKVQGLVGNEVICIVKNDAVRQDFLDAYERQIKANGFKTNVIENKESSTCPLTTSYTASYGFHWGTYLATAELLMYKGNDIVGKAVYKAPLASPAKHGRVESKIQKLVAQLLN